MYVCVYVYLSLSLYLSLSIYIYSMWRERERGSERERERDDIWVASILSTSSDRACSTIEELLAANRSLSARKIVEISIIVSYIIVS